MTTGKTRFAAGPGEGDDEALPGRLLEEAAPAVLRARPRRRVVAGHLHVAAERQEREAVLGLARGGTPKRRGPKPMEKRSTFTPERLRHEEVARARGRR